MEFNLTPKGGENISTDKQDKFLMPGVVAFEDSNGHVEVLFADTAPKQVIGPGAIDPQDAEKLQKLTGGYTEISYGDVEDGEYIDTLRDRDGMVRYFKMQDDDAVRNGLNYIFGAIRSIPYHIEYASEDPLDLEAAAFISDQLGIESSRAGKYPFQRLVRIFENSLVYGSGYGEIVLKLADGKAVLDTVIPYHPLVVEGIVYDNKGGPKAVKINGKIKGEDGKQIDKEIPIYKMVIFLNEDDGDMKGRSILRAAVTPYEIKKVMLRLVNAGFERYLLGIPVFKAPKGINSKSPEWAIAKQMGVQFAGNPKAGLTLPEGWDFEVMSVNSQMPDALPYINMMNEAISRSMGIEFNSLGKNGNGSGGYGTSQLLHALSERTIRTYVDAFVDYINTYLIPKLMVANYPQLKNYPMLSYSEFTSEVPSSLLQLLQSLMQMTVDISSAETQAQLARETLEQKATATQEGNAIAREGLAAKSEVAKKGGGVALNAETTNVSASNSSQSSSQDGEAGGFKRPVFDQMIDALPARIRDQLGYSEEKRKKLLADYRTSTSTGYTARN